MKIEIKGTCAAHAADDVAPGDDLSPLLTNLCRSLDSYGLPYTINVDDDAGRLVVQVRDERLVGALDWPLKSGLGVPMEVDTELTVVA